MAKRGRKPNPDKKKEYFGVEQEKAVVEYLSANAKEEKEEIYINKLMPAFNKMIESIIRRYKLYFPDEESGETFNDTLSYLITKTDKFEAGKHKKAYSYYGTICKNYLIGRINNYNKEIQRNKSYEDVANEFTNNIKYSDITDRNHRIANDSIKALLKEIDKMLETPSDFKLKESEIKMGRALKNLLENWDYVLTTNASNKLNKNAILLFLRESTGFDTKGIRDNMKKYKKVFFEIKEYIIAND